MRFPPTHCSSLYRSSLVGTVNALGSCLGITLSYRTMSPIRSTLLHKKHVTAVDIGYVLQLKSNSLRNTKGSRRLQATLFQAATRLGESTASFGDCDASLTEEGTHIASCTGAWRTALALLNDGFTSIEQGSTRTLQIWTGSSSK